MGSHLQIRKKILFYPYLFGAILVFIALIDAMFFQYELKNRLPSDINKIWIYPIVFGLPHIVTSLLVGFRTEYFKSFKVQYLTFGILIIGFFILDFYSLVSGALLTTIYAYFNFTHVGRQQFGLIPTLDGNQNIYNRLLFYVGPAAVMLTGFYIFRQALPYQFVNIFSNVLVIAIISLAITSALAIKAAHTTMGVCYIVCNLLMVVSSACLAYAGYFIFSILVPRLIHDFTAYLFYIVHDSNRAAEVNQPDWVSSVYNKLGAPVWLLCPILGIGLAYGFGRLSLESGFSFARYLGLMHFAVESFQWRGASLLRKWAPIVDK